MIQLRTTLLLTALATLAFSASAQAQSSGIPLDCTPDAALSGGTWGLGVAQGASLYACGHADANGVDDVEGAMCVAGDLSSNGFNYAHKMLNEANCTEGAAAVVGGGWSASTGQIWGDAWSRFEPSLSATVNFQGGQLRRGKIHSFKTGCQDMRFLSQALATAPHIESTVAFWGEADFRQVELASDTSDVVVFEFDADEIAYPSEFNYPAELSSAQAIVINVRGETFDVGGGEHFMNGVEPKRILWNYPDATSGAFRATRVRGSVLAPCANITTSNGDINGTLVSANLEGDFAFRTVDPSVSGGNDPRGPLLADLPLPEGMVCPQRVMADNCGDVPYSQEPDILLGPPAGGLVEGPGVRFKDLGDIGDSGGASGSGEVYLGVGDLGLPGARVELSNAVTWAAVNDVTFRYDPQVDPDTVHTTVSNAFGSWALTVDGLSVPGCEPADWDVAKISVAARSAEQVVSLVDLSIIDPELDALPIDSTNFTANQAVAPNFRDTTLLWDRFGLGFEFVGEIHITDGSNPRGDERDKVQITLGCTL